MNIITGPRASGKTTKAILEAAKTGHYILVNNQQQAKALADTAVSMSVYIPYPVTVQEIMSHRIENTSLNRDGIIVDNALDVLQELLPVPIKTATLRTNDK